MDINTAEKERIVRFYWWAVSIVEQEVENGFPFLRLLNRTDEESRERYVPFGVELNPTEGILERWKRSLILSHRRAASILGLEFPKNVEFFPKMNWHFNNVLDNYMSNYQIRDTYLNVVDEEFPFVLKKEIEIHRPMGSKQLIEHSYIYETVIDDWIINPVLDLTFFLDAETKANTEYNSVIQCRSAIHFGVNRRDYQGQGFGSGQDHNRKECMGFFSPTSLLRISSDCWVINNDDEIDARVSDFKKVLSLTLGGITENLKGLQIDG